jgi:transglutaminase-like putative cysteine protease
MGWGRSSWQRFGAVAVLAVLVVGCSSSSATWPAIRPSVTPNGSGGPAPSAAHVIIPLSSAHASADATEAPRSTAGAVTVDAITADYTYKSELITPLAHLYGLQDFLDDFVIVTIKNENASPVKVVVETQITDYTDKATDTVTVDANSSEEVRQNPRLTTTAIDSLNSAHQADLHVVVSYLQSGEPKTILDQTSQTTVTSRRDFPWKIKGFSNQEIYNMLAAMITPSDPGVEDLIRKAANYDPSKAMTSGYDAQQDANNSVYQRMADIWQAETTNFKLTYVSTTVSFEAATQRIRLPSEVLTQSGGNCIETTLLYAAAAEALGLDAALILIPGHAYVGISVDDTDQSYYFIETTMIGQATFDDAVKYGLSEWNQAQPHVAAGDAEYGWVDVPLARKDGITPIPWH